MLNYVLTLLLDVSNKEFYDGLKRNSSIHELTLCSYGNNIGVGHEILKAYQQNGNLTLLYIEYAGLEIEVIIATVRRCTNLKQICFSQYHMADEQLLPMVEAIRGHRLLEVLDLSMNRIGNAGCDTLATLLEDPVCNLRILDLTMNRISNVGATALANGLRNNTKLKELRLSYNPACCQSTLEDIFSKLLCNMTSINTIHSSNHTLKELWLPQRILRGQQLFTLLKLNRKCTNKSHVAIKKILKHHPSIDMEPFFEWIMEGEGERDLKALPYVIAWFDRAREAVASDGGGESYNIGERELSAMYQFVGAMPLLFVPASHIRGNENKRKRDESFRG